MRMKCDFFKINFKTQKIYLIQLKCSRLYLIYCNNCKLADRLGKKWREGLMHLTRNPLKKKYSEYKFI